jgi:hypothetical protein
VREYDFDLAKTGLPDALQTAAIDLWRGKFSLNVGHR